MYDLIISYIKEGSRDYIEIVYYDWLNAYMIINVTEEQLKVYYREDSTTLKTIIKIFESDVEFIEYINPNFKAEILEGINKKKNAELYEFIKKFEN